MPGKGGGGHGGGKGKGKPGRGRRRDDDEYGYSRNQPLQKPENQEKLSDQQLKEEFIRSLSTTDPLRAKNLVMWDYVEGVFVPYQDTEPMITIFYMESELFNKETEEINEYKGELIDEIEDAEDDEKLEEEAGVDKGKPGVPNLKKLEEDKKRAEASKPTETVPSTAEGEDADQEKDEKEEAPPPPPSDKPKKLLNQFNFCERASQTYEQISREHGTQTQPPPQSQYRDMCNQWMIFDAYAADTEHNPKYTKKVGDEGHEGEEDPSAAAAAEKKTPPEKTEKEKTKKSDKESKLIEKERIRMRKQSLVEGQAAVDISFLRAAEGLKYAERMVNTNVFDDVLEDFKYFEDTSDEYREQGDGSLLPLWRFTYEKSKKIHVTCISWSISQPDMFAVSYGSFSFVHPVLDGMVVIYSLKNPAYPEFAWLAPKGSMSCHIHPERNCLVCVGLYDGNVAILNLEKNEENESRTEVLKNVPILLKHRAPVWSVKWNLDDLDGNPSFFSAGMDGRIIHWIVGVTDQLGFGGLEGTEISTLHLPLAPAVGPDGTSYKLFGCARCLAFHPKETTTFLVGTAEGNIFRCSSLYGSRFQQIYNAHFLPVAALQWNHYHYEVFMSCSEDWTIKIWDRRDMEPMYVFEIGVPILDVCWAPYSSTVFGACTEEGKVLIYDLNVNKEKPICSQQVVTKKKIHPHRISFNPVYPIVIVGDDRGHLTTLKLSPNLRILPKDTRNILLEGEVRNNFEINKMAKLLSLVRDPETVTNPKFIPGPTNLHEITQPVIQNKC